VLRLLIRTPALALASNAVVIAVVVVGGVTVPRLRVPQPLLKLRHQHSLILL
jgi:hypothetical protein